MKRKYSLLAGFATVLAAGAMAQANAGLSLSLTYVGAADAATYASMDVNNDPSPFDGSITLPAVDYTQAANQIPSYTYYFEVGIHFAPDAAGEAFRDITSFDVVLGPGMSIARPDPVAGPTPYWVAVNPNVKATSGFLAAFEQDKDSGTNLDDLQDLIVQQTNKTTAYTSGGLVGQGSVRVGDPTIVGGFAVTFSGPLSANSSITLTGGAGAVFSYFTSSATGVSSRIDPANGNGTSGGSTLIPGNGSDGVTGVTLNIPGSAPVPEPASLGVLALGGVALLARRRKNA